MSVNSDAHSETAGRKRTVEILEPGVELVTPKRHSRAILILTRVFFAVVFLGVGVLAIYYSISTSEQQQQRGSHDIPVSEFNIYRNQYALNGTITIEYNATTVSQQVQKYTMQWVQDDNEHRLVFSKMEQNTNNLLLSFYVFQNHTLIVRPKEENKCEFKSIGYDDFILQFGVVKSLTKSDNDTVKLNGEYQQVEVYEGVPLVNTTEAETLELPGYESGKPRLAFGYALPNFGVTAGFQVYFDPIDDKADVQQVEWVEYWFSDMQDAEPDAEYFVGYTKWCVKADFDQWEEE